MGATQTRMTLGASLLAAWLKENERSQAWLARKVGKSGPAVSAWLDGSSRPLGHTRELIAAITKNGVPVVSWETSDERTARLAIIGKSAA